jgi:hypothetical protein
MASKPKEAYTTVTVKPLGGSLDTRSETSDVALGAWRWKQNWRLRDGEKLNTREGFEKAFSDESPYTNFDLHDQGWIGWPNPTREMITLEFEATKNDGSRFLYAGTQSRLYWLNETTGLWNLIVSGKGGAYQPGLAQTRFKAAELQEKIIFTNNIDTPLYTAVGAPGVSEIPDLNSLGITAAGVVVQFSGFIMIMDVVEDGDRQASRIWWSDFNQPITFNPGAIDPVTGATSLSNFQDLDYGQQILAAVPMAGALYIFTSAAIWRCTPSANDQVFNFTKVYSEPLNQAKCLVYPNTLVSTGNGVWYASIEAIYYFDPYLPEPQRPEWLFRGGAIMFSDQSALDPSCCQSPVACVKPDEKEIYVSWPELSANVGGGCVNSKTLIFNYEYKSPDIYDHGFSAFANYRPSAPDTANCKGASQLFLGASTTDLCLKSIGVNFSREMLTNTSAVGSVVNGVFVPFTGEYQATGYYRILRMLLPLLNYDRNKLVRQILLEAHPADQINPCIMRCRFGNTFSESDPNLPDDFCSVLWHQLKDNVLKCLDTRTAGQYVKANIVREQGLQWNFLYGGRFAYVEFSIANSDGSPAIGGDCAISRIEVEVQLQTK